jgi:CelD/BcsL family acetyltransferase involved in cellulose biosynthesis
MMIDETKTKFVIGSRQIFAATRTLETVSFTLDHLLGHKTVAVPSSAQRNADGYRVLSVPLNRYAEFINSNKDSVVGGFQSYRRFYIDMAGSYADYLGRFSSKTRSTFNRKRRKLAEFSGGELDIREYRTPEDMDIFLNDAIPLSRRTYQARLLDAGFPESDAAREEMIEMARADKVRAYLLFIDNKAVSYLYLPIHDGIILYAFLGYDPDIANLSPGTVLQLDALERLFAEGQYRYFDFTEGEGAHKAMFGTDSVEACSFFLLKATIGNRFLLNGLKIFDGSIATFKRLAEKSGVQANIRKMLRG